MNNKNEVGGVILVLKNITEQHRIDRLQKNFVANVSHELKNTHNYHKRAMRKSPGRCPGRKRKPPKEFLNVINSESDRNVRLVTDLLLLSKMELRAAKFGK